MSDLALWHEQNESYLAAALHWLRLRLLRLAGPEPVVTGEAEMATSAKTANWWNFRRGEADHIVTNHLALPAPSSTITDEEIAQAAAAMAAAEAVEPRPALLLLRQRFGLSRFEQEILLLCAAMELDTRTAALCARAQDDAQRRFPTFGLALALFDDPTWDALSPERPLRYWRLIEINQPGAQPLTASALRADERIVNHLKGLNYLDDRLAPLLTALDGAMAGTDLPPSQHAVVVQIVRHLEQIASGRQAPVIQLLGADTPSKQLIADVVADTLGLHVYRMRASLLPTQAADLETFLRLWQRESALLPVVLYLDASEAEQSQQSEGVAASINRFLAGSNVLCFLDTREHWSGLARPNLAFDIAKPTATEQQELWAAMLGTAVSPELPVRLAGQFNLNAADIRRIAQVGLSAEDAAEREAQLWDACLLQARPRLDMLARRIEPGATWEQLVLPEKELKLLQQVAAQVEQRRQVYDEWGFRQRMNRGMGISVLFAGESGTGKTMAAEVIANDLRLNLYRIDLSQVVSKYIGETEKNLRRLFDAAEDGGTILFFDEADALFGKRSEVKDSHDRYANIEINYLLQRMEAYRGLAILATNMRSALDQAFLRRLRFIVTFNFPGIAERKQMWQKVFPPETPLNGIDYGRLAKLSLTGGSIQNIALNAAFLAARAGTPVTMPLLLDAARTELRKMEKPMNEADFRL